MGVPDPTGIMDPVECSAVYIDHRVTSERWVYQRSSDASAASSASDFLLPDEPESLREDVELLLEVSKRIYLCYAGPSLATTLAEISDRAHVNCTPILAFFDVDLNTEEPGLARRKSSRGSWSDMSPPSPSSMRRGFTFSTQSVGSYDLNLLSGLSADIQVQESANLIIPVAILRAPPTRSLSPTSAPMAQPFPQGGIPAPQHISKCLDAGAVDVISAPLVRDRVQGLTVHVYRAHKSAVKEQSRFLSKKKLRKHSWVGVSAEQPYSYLREAMVSKLMKGICNPEETIEEFQDRELDVTPERVQVVKEQIGKWEFTAHEFSDDELVLGAFEMLQHAFTIPDLEDWRLPPGELRTFLLACRASYNSFVLYHNFRHAIDVLQSIFCFLLHIGALPPYEDIPQDVESKSPIASLLTPFDTLTLLISAIGHDVGHPGVNNFFLVKLNAPLAQLYNDNSVLEAFHCAAFSQILRRYWPAAFKDRQLRKLLISSILATDMGVHQKFMERLGSLQEKFVDNNRTVDGWKPQDLDMYKTLVCGLLIKCADISNVSRPWAVAEKWTQILQEEFAHQGEMEQEVGMETALFGGPPELGNIFKLATGQMGFMTIFALPLFEGVTHILPQMRFTVEHTRTNHAKWQCLAELEKRKLSLEEPCRADQRISPRSTSPQVAVDRRSSKKSTAPHTPDRACPAGGDDASDYFGSARSSVVSRSPGNINENTIKPVVSPDTPGPAMDITGSSLPASRKSSSAVPDLTMVSIAGASPRRSAQAVEGGLPLGDPGVMAAVCHTDMPPTGYDHHAPSSTRDFSLEEESGERANSSRNGPPSYRRHHANTNSSGRAPPSNSQRNSCTRTHSLSTYSNAMTPISPATNATSFLSEYGDDKAHAPDSAEPDDSDFSSAHPESSIQYTVSDRDGSNFQSGDSHTSHSQAEDTGKGPSPEGLCIPPSGMDPEHGGSGSPTLSATPTGSHGPPPDEPPAARRRPDD
ncbi:HD-domain/PDEase-like protein [Aspergillus campestris IBT 28561]|uniref:Phosphodiesterase n=1 Tax=Aspergillus campestris (strain IBT 28561) TaxID=1392248 RepID=A0A2I1D4R6_ASPC2|nr:HD-domain/PDEase-like protein [Aspergillus campestris IBT 28561]PKY04863.1 HD-domain/PDEase-like protein [Aspergillus campestris IBT 28561]